MFKIISVGWQCAQFLERTLQSVENQTVRDWEMMIVYDNSTDNGAELIEQWATDHNPFFGGRYHYQLNSDQRFAVRNQYEGLEALDPADDDIIVFLDLDGDQLAHASVLDNLLTAYSDGTTLLTYGNYEPVPHVDTCPPAVAFPDDVVASVGYRHYILSGAGSCFNHLRTMKGKVFKAIPEDRFHWANSDEWYQNGTDYVFMVNGLELVGGKYKCLTEVLCLYNHDNPLADNITHPAATHQGVQDMLARPPLAAAF
jgi:glycosyltransferase involved in cell wall biosynthesis